MGGFQGEAADCQQGREKVTNGNFPNLNSEWGITWGLLVTDGQIRIMEFDQNIELMLIKSHEMQPKHLNGKIGTVRSFLGIIFFSAPFSGSLSNFSINTKKLIWIA